MKTITRKTYICKALKDIKDENGCTVCVKGQTVTVDAERLPLRFEGARRVWNISINQPYEFSNSGIFFKHIHGDILGDILKIQREVA